MSRGPLLLLVLCACALGLAACGGSDGGDDDVATILSQTFGKGKEVKSGRLDLSLRLDAKGLQQLPGPVAVKLSGPFQSSGADQLPKFDFEAAIDLSGQQLKAGAISTGDKGFVTFQDQAYAVSDELFKQFKDGYAEQAKCNAQRDGDKGASFSALGISPGRWLTGAEKAGEQKVGGTDATHITGSIDVNRFLDDVNRILGRTNPQQADPCADAKSSGADKQQPGSRRLTDAQRQAIASAIKSAKVDIWTGKKDRTMRRVNVAVKFDVPAAQRKAAGGLTSGDLSFDLTIGALNEKQTITAPAKSQPLDDLIAALNGQAAGAGAGAGGSGNSGSSGASATPSSKYEQCMAAAGQDVKKLQGCADLIGQ